MIKDDIKCWDDLMDEEEALAARMKKEIRMALLSYGKQEGDTYFVYWDDAPNYDKVTALFHNDEFEFYTSCLIGVSFSGSLGLKFTDSGHNEHAWNGSIALLSQGLLFLRRMAQAGLLEDYKDK